MRQRASVSTKGTASNPGKSLSKNGSVSTGKSGSRIIALWEIAVLFVLTVVVLSPTLGAPELLWMDDMENLPYRFGPKPALTWNNLKLCFQPCLGVTEPVGTLFKLLLCVAAESSVNPFPHHVVNQLLHGANILLLLVWLRRIFPGKNQEVQFGTLVATAWWAVHPFRAEAIGWIACQPYLLAGFFCLIGLLAFEKGHFIVTFLCSAVAAHCKVPAAVVVVPIALRAIDCCRRGVLACALLVLAVVGAGVSSFVIHAAALHDYQWGNWFAQPAGGLPLWPDRVIRGCYTFWFCVGHEFYPVGLCARQWLPVIHKDRLSPKDPLFGASFAAFLIMLLLAGVGLLCGIPTLWRRFQTRDPASAPTKAVLPMWLGASLYWVALLATLFPPMKVLVQHGDATLLGASRYTYLPDLFITAPAAAGLLSRIAKRFQPWYCAEDSRLPRHPVKVGLALLGGFMLFQARWCRWYSDTWRTTEGVYNQVLDVNPLESYAAYNYAHYMAESKASDDLDIAKKLQIINRYRHALDVAERAGDDNILLRVCNNLGSWLNEIGEHSLLVEAERVLGRGLALVDKGAAGESRDLPFRVPYNFGHTMVKLNRPDRALLLYQRAGAVMNFPEERWEGLRNGAAIAIRIGRTKAARRLAVEGLEVNPRCEACAEMIAHIDSSDQKR
eukprot:TRINITY_DN43076_c0_g1_i1.p1 TRINITY_DN43076_c0_g1~~TRINITY_DN43076_c0_g1_i1.p1  ORF type:complete len:669 (+),score=67.29 TRINITY_DN43076_c0_g1_i1:166-2172(+)